MGRPSKSMKLHEQRTETKEEMNKRILVEEALQGEGDKLEPSGRLNANQKKIFRYIVGELEKCKLLGNLDSFMLETGCIAIDRLQSIEKTINQDFEMIRDKDLMAAKRLYSTDFAKFVNDACLSPQARAKMGILAANKALEETDPLLKVLKSKSS